MQARLASMLLLLACCGPASSSARPVEVSGPTCDAHAASLERRLQETPDRPLFFVPDDLEPPRTGASGVPPEDGLEVFVPVEGPVYFDYQEIDAEQVGAACEARRQLVRARGFSLTLQVLADRRVSFERLGPLFAGCADRALLLAIGDEAPDACPPSLGELCDRLSELGFPTVTEAEGDAWVIAMGECHALARSLARVAELGPEGRNDYLRRAIPAALRECGCAGADAAAIEFLAVRSLRSMAPDVRAFEPDPTSFDPDTLVGDWVDAQR